MVQTVSVPPMELARAGIPADVARMNARIESQPPHPSDVDRHPVERVIERLEQLTDHEQVEVGNVVAAFGSTSFVPLLMVPALIVFSPLSGIPFLPTIFGLIIALVSLQMSVRKRHIWLPKVLMRRQIKGARLARALSWLGPAARWIDKRARQRLRFLTAFPFVLAPQLACVACGLAMPFLELVPFSSSILAAAVLTFSVAFLARDGLFVLIGGSFMGLAALVPILVFGGS